MIRRLGVDQENPRSSLNQPASVEYADAALFHGIDAGGELGRARFELFDLDGGLRDGQ